MLYTLYPDEIRQLSKRKSMLQGIKNMSLTGDFFFFFCPMILFFVYEYYFMNVALIALLKRFKLH